MAQVLDEVADINDYNNNENDISITKHGIRTVTDINNTFTEPPLYLFSGYTKRDCNAFIHRKTVLFGLAHIHILQYELKQLSSF